MAKHQSIDPSNARVLVLQPAAPISATPFVSEGRVVDDDLPQIQGLVRRSSKAHRILAQSRSLFHRNTQRRVKASLIESKLY